MQLSQKLGSEVVTVARCVACQDVGSTKLLEHVSGQNVHGAEKGAFLFLAEELGEFSIQSKSGGENLIIQTSPGLTQIKQMAPAICDVPAPPDEVPAHQRSACPADFGLVRQKAFAEPAGGHEFARMDVGHHTPLRQGQSKLRRHKRGGITVEYLPQDAEFVINRGINRRNGDVFIWLCGVPHQSTQAKQDWIEALRLKSHYRTDVNPKLQGLGG